MNLVITVEFNFHDWMINVYTTHDKNSSIALTLSTMTLNTGELSFKNYPIIGPTANRDERYLVAMTCDFECYDKIT